MADATTVDEYEYVIVGSGSAGCVMAERLGRDATVVVVEAGPWLAPPATLVASAWPTLMGGEADWAYLTTPQAGLGGRPTLMPHGRIVGGSSQTNGLLWTRGDRSDFDAWAYEGAVGWGYADLEPYFRKVEGYQDGDATHLGIAGPLHLENRRNHGPHPAASDFVAAAVARGHRRVHDFNEGGDVAGAGFFTINARGDQRVGARQAYLEPAIERGDVTLIAGTRVTKIIVESGRAVGVVVGSGDAARAIRAGREVLLASSTAETPKLLMLSGIGPEDELRKHGIPVVHPLAGVGQGLQDHVSVAVPYAPTRAIPASGFGDDAALFFASREWAGTDMEMIFFAAPQVGLQMRVGVVRPLSRGTVALRDNSPDSAPLLDPAFLAVPADLTRLVAGVRESMGVASTAPLSDWIAGVDGDSGLTPGMSDIAMGVWVRGHAQGFAHMVGGARVGLDEGAVVDPQLRVRGLEGLRVVDTSVFPSVPAGHTQAAVMAVAERASDLILGRPVLKPASARPTGAAQFE